MNVRFFISILILFVFFNYSYAESHRPQAFLIQIHGAKDEGMQIYNHFCVNCHAKKPLIELGAPKIGDAHDWSLRLKQGMKILFQHTDEGLNAMPPRGGCFECTDNQLLLSIIEMLPKSSESESLNGLEVHKKSKK